MRKAIQIGAAIFFLATALFIWKSLFQPEKAKVSAEEVDYRRYLEDSQASNRANREAAINEQAQVNPDHSHGLTSILARAAKEMSQAACRERTRIVTNAKENMGSAAIIELLNNFTTNQCSQFQKQNSDALLKVTLDEKNLAAFIQDHNDGLDNQFMPYLKLFRSALAELEKNNSEELRESLFSALDRFIEDSTTLLATVISGQIVLEAAEKNLLRKPAANDALHLKEELDHDRREFIEHMKRTSAQYRHLDLANLSVDKIASQLGVEGVRHVFLENMGRESQIAEKFRKRLLDILK